MTWINIAADGSAQALLEDFQFGVPAQQRRRPTWLRARVRPVANTTRFRSGVTPVALQGILADARPFNLEYGHLLGLSLGGLDVPQNLVPMYGSVNRGTYRDLERELQNHLTGCPNPSVLIGISYPTTGFGVDDDPRVPSGFKVWFYSNMPDITQAVPMGPHWRAVANGRAGSVRMPIQGGDIARREFHMELRAKTLREKWTIEMMGGAAVAWSHWLPPADQRPYGYLDRLIYSPEFASYAQLMMPRWDACEIGPGKEFAEAQRVNVVYANCYTQNDERKGECWSDDRNDPVKTVLTELGSDNGIQIDHIFPKASMGPNIYSNAQVLSAAHNRSKGRS